MIDDSERILILVGHLFLRTKGVQGVLEIRRVCRVLVTLFKGLTAVGGLPMIALNCVCVSHSGKFVTFCWFSMIYLHFKPFWGTFAVF